ncbi:hypothetical protein HDU98_006597 [Podochytrium sp. JEL0797]|nr:hypothetical protein HDU98_006597 [Podochytrium sp. JEL0797]
MTTNESANAPALQDPTAHVCRTGIRSMAPELLTKIALLLPVDHTLKNVAFASKTLFAPIILYDEAFARALVKKLLSGCRHGETLKSHFGHRSPYWEEDEEDELSPIKPSKKTEQWTLLPLTHKIALFKTFFCTPDRTLSYSTPTTFRDLRDKFFDFFPLSAPHALRLVESLCLDAKFDLGCQNNRILSWACSYGLSEAVALILAQERFAVNENDEFLSTPIRNKHGATVRTLLADLRIPVQRHHLVEAVEHGHVEAVALLLKCDRVDVSINPTEFTNTACSRPSLKILQLLCNDPRIGFASVANIDFVLALNPPRWPVVEFLMALPHLDPSHQQNVLFYSACSDGKLSIVKKLLSDARVNPFDRNNRAFVAACKMGHVQVVRVLLELKSLDPSLNDNEAVSAAVRAERQGVVRLLCNDERVRASADKDVLDYALACYCADRDNAMVRQVLQYDIVDPSSWSGFQVACVHGNVELVELLICDSRLSPVTNEEFLQELFESKSFDVIRLLLQHKSSNVPRRIINHSFEQACANQKTAFTKLLLLHHNLRIPTSLDFKSATGHANLESLLRAELVAAEKRCDILTMRSVLEHPKWDPTNDDAVDNVLEQLLKNPYFKNREFIHFMLAHRRFNSLRSKSINSTFQSNCSQIVNLLLFRETAPDPSARNNHLLYWAVENAFNPLVEILVNSTRLRDISSDNHHILRAASHHCSMPIVEALFRHNQSWYASNHIVPASTSQVLFLKFGELLLSGSKGDASADDNQMLLWAVEERLPCVLEILVCRFEVDTSIWNEHVFAVAAERNDCATVKVLLQTVEVDVASRSYYGLRKLVEHGCVDCLRQLLDMYDGDEDVASFDVSFDGNILLLTAAKMGHDGVVELLMESGLLDGVVGDYAQALRLAEENGHGNTASLLRYRIN